MLYTSRVNRSLKLETTVLNNITSETILIQSSYFSYPLHVWVHYFFLINLVVCETVRQHQSPVTFGGNLLHKIFRSVSNFLVRIVIGYDSSEYYAYTNTLSSNYSNYFNIFNATRNNDSQNYFWMYIYDFKTLSQSITNQTIS